MAEATSFTSEGVQFAWDATSIKAAWECPRKYYYSILCGYQSPFKGVHLWFGGHYATAMEHFHKYCAAGNDRETAIRKVVLEALIATWDHEIDKKGNRIPSTGGPRRYDEPNKTRETLIRSIVWYFDEWKDDPFRTFIKDDGTPAVELSFRLPVQDDIVFCGHMDRVATSPEDEFFIHDQKTTKQTLSPYYWNQFKPDDQIAGMYPFVGQIIYKLPIKGVMVDAAQVMVGFTRYSRQMIHSVDTELEEWYDETMELIHRVQGYTRENFFPRNKTACNNFGGCEFRSVCSRPAFVRDNLLSGDFKKRDRWDPIKAR